MTGQSRDSGKDHERIWLQSYDDTEALGEDRLWCEDKVWPDDPEDHEPTEYIRADLFAALEAERDELKAAKWAEKHVDTINDMAALRIALDGAEAMIAELRAALEPFAREAAELSPGIADDCVYALPRFPELGLSEFDVGDLRRARAALKGDS